MSSYHVLIPSAGNGARMQSATPKQYLALQGKPILTHVLAVFEACDQISTITVVIAPNDIDWQPSLLQGCRKTRVLPCGGSSRAESVLNGLKALQPEMAADDWMLVHDAARPGLDATMLNRLLKTVTGHPSGGLLAMPLADTLKKADAAQNIDHTVPRELLWQAQTPQMFRHAALLDALTTHLHRQPTDEAQAMEWMGHHPLLVMGGLKNMKVTYPTDLAVVEALMKAANTQKDNV